MSTWTRLAYDARVLSHPPQLPVHGCQRHALLLPGLSRPLLDWFRKFLFNDDYICSYKCMELAILVILV
jgi:hypothetical protein